MFADPSGEAPPLADHVGRLAEELDRYRPPTLKRAARIDYDVKANWKAIVENYSECLHCPGVHPELNRLSHYLSGDDYEGPGAWCGGSMTLNEDAETMAQNGGQPGARRSPGVDPRKVLYFAIFPNCLISFHPDYVMLHTLWPRGAGPHRGRLRVVLRARDHGARRASTTPTRSSSGTSSTARTGTCASSASSASARPATRPAATPRSRATVHDFDRMVAEAYLK